MTRHKQKHTHNHPNNILSCKKYVTLLEYVVK